MWVLFALLAGAFYTASGLLTRHVLKSQQDAWAFSFFFSAGGALVSLPFVVLNHHWSSRASDWLLLGLLGLLIVGHNWLNFRSSNYLEASLTSILTKFRLVWTLLFGVVLLGEAFSWTKVAGTMLTIVAGLVVFGTVRRLPSIKGVWLALSATVVYAVVIVGYKMLFSSFNSATLTFFIFLIPAGLNYVLMPQSWQRITRLWLKDGKPVLWAALLGGGANLAMNQALSLGEMSQVVVIIEASLILTLIGEHLWLKETEHRGVKIMAAVAAIVGAILIQIK